jgi:hypothetical protein
MFICSYVNVLWYFVQLVIISRSLPGSIFRYIHFSTVCSERDSLKMGKFWRRIAGLGSHLIDLKIWDMILSQKCNNGNYLTFWNMKVVIYKFMFKKKNKKLFWIQISFFYQWQKNYHLSPSYVIWKIICNIQKVGLIY